MLRLRRSLLIMVLVAGVSVAAGVGRTINAEEPISPTGGLATSSQPEVSPAVVVPGGPGFYSQYALSFRPYSMSTQWAFIGMALSVTGTSGGTFVSPVSLPHGATINKVVWYYYDNSSTQDTSFYLVRDSLDGSAALQIASSASTGAQNTFRYAQTTSISYPTVDLQSYAYSVVVSLPPDTSVGILSYRIDYQYPGYLPTVMKNSN